MQIQVKFITVNLACSRVSKGVHWWANMMK